MPDLLTPAATGGAGPPAGARDTDYSRCMGAALDQAQQALSIGEFPVGCVLAYRGRPLATGARRGTRGRQPNERDHAEIIALERLDALQTDIDRQHITLFCTLEPCLMCFAALLLGGIRTIVYAYEDVMGGGTGCDLSRLPPLYRDAAVRVIPHVRRRESLKLFKAYYANPATLYWKDSLLARYTLQQPDG